MSHVKASIRSELSASRTSTTLSFFRCFDEKPPSEFQNLPCRHQHCTSCLKSYLQLTIGRHNDTHYISCPSRCNQVIDDDLILRLVSDDKKLSQRYLRYLIQTFVQSNRLTTWCPGNGCSTVVKMKTYTPNCAQLIECDMCKLLFCFQCSRQWHEPMTCSLLTEWETKNRDESMTGQWLLASQ